MPVRCPKCKRSDGLFIELPTKYALVGTASTRDVRSIAIGEPDDAAEGYDPEKSDDVGCLHTDCEWTGLATDLEFLDGPSGPPPITPEAAARYIADRGGSGCPACGHVDGVKGYHHGPRHFEPIEDAARGRKPVARQSLECRECGACWIEAYTLTRLETYRDMTPIGPIPIVLEVIEVGYIKGIPSIVLRGTEESTKPAVAWLYQPVEIRPVPRGD